MRGRDRGGTGMFRARRADLTAPRIIMRAMSAPAAEKSRRVRVRGQGEEVGGPHAFGSSRALAWAEMRDAPVRWPRPSRLSEPLELPSRRAGEAMRALGVETVGELLEHLPTDSRVVRTVATLRAEEQATVAVRVQKITSRAVRRRGMRPLVLATVADASGSMRATFFNQPWLLQRYRPGTPLLLHGKADGRGGFRVIHHATGGDAGDSATAAAREAAGGERGPGAGAVGHYRASEGVTSTQIMGLVRDARAALRDVIEPLPGMLRASERLPERAGALAAMHFPRDARDGEEGRVRLAFEELLLTQLVFLRRRARRREASGALVLDAPPALTARWLEHSLPFALTADQRRAIAEIDADLREPRAMQRMLMGEVGSGKTVVALYAMLRAVENGHQAALMAPTETLAEQHFATLQRLLGAEHVSVALLTGSTPGRRRADVLGKLESGELALIVGTHALIETDVRFRSLAVAVIDEQHRFGVRQRAALDAKGTPHTLHMTATPIPRTLALAGYGDLDTSALRELPSGRRAISTRVVSGERERERAYELLRGQLDQGRQAYVVCPLIEEEDAPEGLAAAAGGARASARAAKVELQNLREGELAGYELVLLHGAMRPREKQQAMARFSSGEAQVLVATTVIEVGIDIPNATVMVVENAERFGISQLHQLRGRVGRGEHRSSCLLMGPSGSVRLRALEHHSDGFRLAEIDLELRKEGELVGTRQSGMGAFRVACLPDDAPLQERARGRAEVIIARDPELRAPENALLAAALESRFGSEALAPIPG
jgi:ATP-dependent DNA helicase RecG